VVYVNGAYVGKVRPAYIKRTAMALLEKYPDKFTSDFEHNKRVASELLKTTKRVRNRVAGYITRLIKRQERFKALEETTASTAVEEGEE
jgi:small subunit ribosomal protein S17e